MKTELEQKEEFGVPDISKTMDIKSANYEKLNEKGFVSIGTRIEKGDAVIGKFIHLPKATNDKFLFVDKSVIYKDDEPAIVHNVIVAHNEEDERFAKIILRKVRPVIVGDKFSIPVDDEILTSEGWLKLRDIVPKKHNIATLRDGKHLEYHQASDKWEYLHTGLMYEFKARRGEINIFCTPNHKLYCATSNDPDFRCVEARDVFCAAKRFKTSIPFDNSSEMIECRETITKMTNKGPFKWHVAQTIEEANEMSELCFKAGWSSKTTEIEPMPCGQKYRVNIDADCHEYSSSIRDIEHYVPFCGMVGCIEVPNHVFYTRRSPFSSPVWTGNSARSGQKSVCALLMRDSDMPFTKDGVRPAIIFNPHGIPSRMNSLCE